MGSCMYVCLYAQVQINDKKPNCHRFVFGVRQKSAHTANKTSYSHSSCLTARFPLIKFDQFFMLSKKAKNKIKQLNHFLKKKVK